MSLLRLAFICLVLIAVINCQGAWFPVTSCSKHAAVEEWPHTREPMLLAPVLNERHSTVTHNHAVSATMRLVERTKLERNSPFKPMQLPELSIADPPNHLHFTRFYAKISNLL
ncbi:unnamed protein product, partial [Mesorhabditis belari]|uniref:Uncharacterized protein n=1 Tax=Mesorhabditis belari TaxID=2138241 RepID=A0AAF3EBJ3_9BILA